jgi:hypothetical protein
MNIANEHGLKAQPLPTNLTWRACRFPGRAIPCRA